MNIDKWQTSKTRLWLIRIGMSSFIIFSFCAVGGIVKPCIRDGYITLLDIALVGLFTTIAIYLLVAMVIEEIKIKRGFYAQTKDVKR